MPNTPTGAKANSDRPTMTGHREIWFRNLFRWAPWSVIPIHWKGWGLIIAGPITLLAEASLLFPLAPAVGAGLFLAGIIAYLLLVYSHTTWDRH